MLGWLKSCDYVYIIDIDPNFVVLKLQSGLVPDHATIAARHLLPQTVLMD